MNFGFSKEDRERNKIKKKEKLEKEIEFARSLQLSENYPEDVKAAVAEILIKKEKKLRSFYRPKN